MPISKTKDILGQLIKLEQTVSAFSFEELSAEEAKVLQNSFNTFKSKLEDHIYGRPAQNEDTMVKEVEHGAEQKPIGQNQLIAHVSHEIRTPLNSIIGFANLLNEEKLSHGQHKKVEAIQFASNSLLKIINEVLEYSKTSSGSNNLENIDFKLHSFLNDIMFLTETLIVDRQIELIIEIDDKVPPIIKGDPSKLSQVLLNLLGNAIKFVHEGYIKLEVSLKELLNDQCTLQFSVADTGIGISKQKLNTIFDSYTQAEEDTYSKYGGTGLGLSITKEIIEKQNGVIDIDSKLGKGTTVTFSIPYTVGNSTNIPLKRLQSFDPQKGKELLAGTEIIVFEDNLMNQHLIQEQLTQWGCKVYTQVTLEKGMAILASKKIDLILMDLKMPDLNGFEISKLIRSDKNAFIKNTPIVAFSADFTEQDSKECTSLGINDFLLKPYTLEDLMNTILKNKRKESAPVEFARILKKEVIQSKKTTEIDLTHILNECFGDFDILDELIKLFKMNVLEFIGNVKLNLLTSNLKEIAFSAHKLKAGFAMLKADGMRDLIMALEAHCKANNLKDVKELYAIFIVDYPLLEQNLDKGLAALKE